MDLEEGRMEKGMILYQSKYGAARKYAGWLREETGFEIREVKNCKIEEVLCFERLILCSGIYASGIAGISFFQKNIEKLQGKQLFVFTVGASPYHENALKELKRKKYERRSLRYPSILWERNVARREDDMEGPDALQDAEKGGGEKSSGYVGTMDGCTDEYKWSKL